MSDSNKPYNFRDGLAEGDPVLYELLQNAEHAETTKAATAELEAKRQLKRAQQAFIEQLYKARAHSHMTQVQLAEKTGMSQTAIARLESGKSNPTLKTLLALAQALDVTLTAEPTSVTLKKT